MCCTAYGAVYEVYGRFSGQDSLYCAVCGALYDVVYSQFPGPDSLYFVSCVQCTARYAASFGGQTHSTVLCGAVFGAVYGAVHSQFRAWTDFTVLCAVQCAMRCTASFPARTLLQVVALTHCCK